MPTETPAVAPSAPAPAVAWDASKSDAKIVKEVSDLARKVLRWIGTGYEAPLDFKFYDAKDPRAVKAWKIAVEIYEDFTATEVHDAVEGECDRLSDRELSAEPQEAPTPDRALREAARAFLSASDAVGFDPETSERARKVWARRHFELEAALADHGKGGLDDV